MCAAWPTALSTGALFHWLEPVELLAIHHRDLFNMEEGIWRVAATRRFFHARGALDSRLPGATLTEPTRTGDGKSERPVLRTLVQYRVLQVGLLHTESIGHRWLDTHLTEQMKYTAADSEHVQTESKCCRVSWTVATVFGTSFAACSRGM